MLGQVTVIGCGLIGGSVVKSLRANRGARRLCAIDRDDVLSKARPFLDEGVATGSREAADLVARSDLVVLAMPVGAIIRNLGWVLGAIGVDAVVTDTGSVKEPVLSAVRAKPRSARFVAGHPMAGRETGGFEASTPELFQGARWFLVPDARESKEPPDERAVDRVAALARAVGADPMVIDARAHDRAMAYVSHAPQLVASALYGVAARAGVLGEAGPGFRDVTRIAGGPSSMWRDIFDTNRREIASALADILEPLVLLRDQLNNGDEKGLEAAIRLLEEVQRAKGIGPGASSEGEPQP